MLLVMLQLIFATTAHREDLRQASKDLGVTFRYSLPQDYKQKKEAISMSAKKTKSDQKSL